MDDEIVIKPIGFIQSELEQRYEAPRQGTLANGANAVIELNPGCNFEQALLGLEGFGRIWVVYSFHLNTNWKPMVTPPRNAGIKVGVFATRAPYRPNGIGLSCVKLEKIEKLQIYISETDMLNGTPVLDIKPYLPYSDSFPGAATGWAGMRKMDEFVLFVESEAEEQAERISENEGQNLLHYAQVQLSFNPCDTTRKRIEKMKDSNIYVLTYQDWKILYEPDEENRVVRVVAIV